MKKPWYILLLELLPGGGIVAALLFCGWVFRPYSKPANENTGGRISGTTMSEDKTVLSIGGFLIHLVVGLGSLWCCGYLAYFLAGVLHG
jgi:hypothetical protein